MEQQNLKVEERPEKTEEPRRPPRKLRIETLEPRIAPSYPSKTAGWGC